MADLYDRIEEIQGMVKILGDDVRSLRPGIAEGLFEVTEEERRARRSYIRAVFALTEAIIEQHKRLLLHLHGNHIIALRSGVAEVLSEVGFQADGNGEVRPKEQFLNFKSKLRTVYKAAGRAFGEDLNIDYGEEGWSAFQDAIRIRDRITHPKTQPELTIPADEIAIVRRAEAWFKTVNNEFVRVARNHREKARGTATAW